MIPFRDDAPLYRVPVVNYALILVNVAVFFLELLNGDAWDVFARFAMIPQEFWRNPLACWYSPVSSVFLHGGWGHLIGNMLFLWVLGDNVEDVLGHGRYLLFYLLAGISGALLQAGINPSSAVPIVGASGAISGILVAYLLFFPGTRISFLLLFIFKVRIPAAIFILLWIAQQFLNGLGSLAGAGNRGGVAYFAHIGGIGYGLLFTMIRGWKLKRVWKEKIRRGELKRKTRPA